MPPSLQRSPHRRIQFVFGLVLAGIFYAEYSQREHKPVLAGRSAIVVAGPRVTVDPFEKLLREDPLAAMIEARARHLREVQDYRCTFIKQELLPSGMSADQEIEVKFLQEPFSVMMHWVRNAGMASRVIYVDGRWTDKKAKNPDDRKLAVCQPGAIGQVFFKSVKLSIHGSLAKKSARRRIDEFGFERTLDLLIKYGKLAKSRGELVLQFRGESRFDGRPVWVIHRRLPYAGNTGLYPDRMAEILIDKEYRVPVAVYCYSDEAREPAHLLGKYEYRNVRFNVDLTEADFAPARYGM